MILMINVVFIIKVIVINVVLQSLITLIFITAVNVFSTISYRNRYQLLIIR
jgi:hypothetical protein